jgi:hypothetical protein
VERCGESEVWSNRKVDQWAVWWMRVICDHVSENTKCNNDVPSHLWRYNVENRSRDKQELREIASVIDKPRTMLETIWEMRDDNKCYLYCLSVVQVKTVWYMYSNDKSKDRLQTTYDTLLSDGLGSPYNDPCGCRYALIWCRMAQHVQSPEYQ